MIESPGWRTVIDAENGETRLSWCHVLRRFNQVGGEVRVRINEKRAMSRVRSLGSADLR